MRKFAVIGCPVSHSLSPALFQAAYPSSQDTYGTIESDSSEEAFDIFLRESYTGANITSPHKDSIVQFCKHTDDIVKKVRASNLIIKKKGVIHGYNTDYLGVMDLVVRLMQTGEIGKKAIVTGAGGAGRAAAWALIDLGFEVYILNRTLLKTSCFAGVPHITAKNLNEITNFSSDTSLLVHAIGHPVPGADCIDFSNMTIIEANYKSPCFSNTACKKYISGKEWLVSQAIPSFRIFTGIEPDIGRMKKIMD